MKLARAKEVLLDGLIADAADEMDHRRRLDVLRNGFKGFARMTHVERLKACYDAGLHEHNDAINEARETIEAWLEIDPTGQDTTT